jgi:hypothetical protein
MKHRIRHHVADRSHGFFFLIKARFSFNYSVQVFLFTTTTCPARFLRLWGGVRLIIINMVIKVALYVHPFL